MIEIRERLSLLLQGEEFDAVLKAGSGPVYLIGGSVRDLLLGREINDYDIVIPDDLEQVSNRAADLLGVHAVPLGRPPLRVYRLPAKNELDLCPLEGRDIYEDLNRRDLTINAIAIDLRHASEEMGGDSGILDPCNGRTDLDAGVVRFVSEGNVVKDPLRLLRLFRFAAELGFDVDGVSLGYVKKHAGLIGNIAGERIRVELLKLMKSDDSFRHIRMMYDCGLLDCLFPEMTCLKGCSQGKFHHLDVLNHTLSAYQELERILKRTGDYFPDDASAVQDYINTGDNSALLKLAVLLHDIAKPATKSVDERGEIHFYGHDGLGAEMFDIIADRLRLSLAEKEFISLIIKLHLQPFFLKRAYEKGELTDRAVYKFSRRTGSELFGVMLHALADNASSLGEEGLKHDVWKLSEFFGKMINIVHTQASNLQKNPRLVNGVDIMERFGLEPSPIVGKILNEIEEERALGRISNADEAFRYAERFLERENVLLPRSRMGD